MPDMVVLGSLNMDLVVRTARMPRPGETVMGERFVTVPGGKGANQAAAAARLGAGVEMIGRVGADSFGPTLMANLRDQGVGVEHVTVDERASTGVALIIVDDKGENSIVVVPGANGRVAIGNLHAARDLLSEARFLVAQLEVPLPVVRAAIQMARELDLRVILNAAPAQQVDADFMRGVFCLVVNEFEAQTLAGIPVTEDLESVSEAGQALLDLGVYVAVITLGARGALLVTRESSAHVPARRVPVVDTTAAGDAFVGGLAVALLDGLDLVDAVRYATCAGTLAATRLGAQPSLPSADEVRAFYRGGQP
jgi:ribokinase